MKMTVMRRIERVNRFIVARSGPRFFWRSAYFCRQILPAARICLLFRARAWSKRNRTPISVAHHEGPPAWNHHQRPRYDSSILSRWDLALTGGPFLNRVLGGGGRGAPPLSAIAHHVCPSFFCPARYIMPSAIGAARRAARRVPLAPCRLPTQGEQRIAGPSREQLQLAYAWSPPPPT